MKMTRYEKFKNDVQEFCQDNGIESTDLQLIKAKEESVSSRSDEQNGHVVLAELGYVSGESEYYAVHIDDIEESEAELDLDTSITSLTVEKDNESEVFPLMESEMKTCEGDLNRAGEVLEKLSAPGIWNNEILNLETGVPRKLQDLYELCVDYQRNGEDEEIRNKAREIANTIENKKIADFHINKLKNIWKFRNSRYNGKDTELIEAAQHEINQFVTVPKRKVEDVNIHLTESI
jgi:hypothetical protein